ncbi:MAG: AAA family ATPase [Hydrogenophaga sp.]|uniref:ParA family protein n=1 Tax=Hydrogenophaga sp. TaxID=1904254 RepID=UPI00261391C2|nr:AAA family ATPase [Hydrogenophaga sp.]MDM7942380.1 AAA family ATPase [Hydrogenophaga sp.]
MAVLAVLNRKGGSGKSTLATNIAAWCAQNGWRVMLGDVDRQQSTRSWLERRDARSAPIVTWAVDNGTVLRAPRGTTHVVLDTPGALYDLDLAKLIVRVDAIVVPVGPSYFDREASVRFFLELRRHPRVVAGHCKLVAVGMRWSRARINTWRETDQHWEIPLLTVIPEDERYRSYLDTGSSFFDEVQDPDHPDAECWLPLLGWLQHIWLDPRARTAASPPRGSGAALTRQPTPARVHPVVQPPPKPGVFLVGHTGLAPGCAKPSTAVGAQALLSPDAAVSMPAYLRRGRSEGQSASFMAALTGSPEPARPPLTVVPPPKPSAPVVSPMASVPGQPAAMAVPAPRGWLSRWTGRF